MFKEPFKMFGCTKHPQGFFDILKEDTDMSVSSFFDPNQSHTCLNLFSKASACKNGWMVENQAIIIILEKINARIAPSA